MSFDTNKIPPSLTEAFKKKSAGLFVGAGLSMAAGLPSWSGLLEGMLDRLRTIRYNLNGDFFTNCEQLLKDSNKFLMLAQVLKAELGSEFSRYISENFYHNCPAPTNLHKSLISYDYEFIITTNYDTLLENAHADLFRKQANVRTFKDSPDIADDLYNHRPFILKAHGDASKTQQGIILTEQDYRQIIFSEKGYQSILQTIFSTRTVLFLGSSLTDPELKLLLSFVHSSFHGRGPMHFALVEAEKMTEVEANSWLSEYNIKLIPYSNANNHIELADFIETFGSLIKV